MIFWSVTLSHLRLKIYSFGLNFPELDRLCQASFEYLLPYTKMDIFETFQINKNNELKKFILILLNLGCIPESEMGSKSASFS